MASSSLTESIRDSLQLFDQVLKLFPGKDQDLSATSLAETVKACTEQFEQILELFPHENGEPSHPLPQKMIDRFSKFLHGTDKDSIHGMSRKMISHQHDRFSSWRDSNQHIVDNQPDLAVSYSTGVFVRVMLRTLVDMKKHLTRMREILSGEVTNEVSWNVLLTPLILYFDRQLSASRAKRFWKPITDTDELHESCDDHLDKLFGLAGEINGYLDREREKEARIEEEKKCFGLMMWEEKQKMDEEREERFRLNMREDDQRREETQRQKMLDKASGA